MFTRTYLAKGLGPSGETAGARASTSFVWCCSTSIADCVVGGWTCFGRCLMAERLKRVCDLSEGSLDDDRERLPDERDGGGGGYARVDCMTSGEDV